MEARHGELVRMRCMVQDKMHLEFYSKFIKLGSSDEVHCGILKDSFNFEKRVVQVGVFNQ